MKVQDLQRTIVQRNQSYEDYDFAALQHEVVLEFRTAAEQVRGGYFPRAFNWFTRMLECFLRISRQVLTLADLRTPASAAICDAFVVALLCPKFYATGRPRTLLAATSAFDVFAIANVPVTSALRPGFGLTKRPAYLKQQLEVFGQFELDSDQVWLWSGWPSKNRAGRVSNLPLFCVFTRLGRPFTEHMYTLCNEFFSKGRSSIIYGLRPLALFIRDYERELTPSHLQDEAFVVEFWREFCLEFFVGRYDEGKGSRVVTLAEQWAQFALLVKDHLCRGRLISDVGARFPVISTSDSLRSNTRVRTREQGEEVHTKLLTEIPLHVSDKEAVKLLFRDIESDLSFVRTWASHHVEQIWCRYLRRQALAAVGVSTVKPAEAGATRQSTKWLTSRKNPARLANAAATLESCGFLPGEEHEGRGIYPTPLPEIAYELGLPITDSLLPHCCLLVDAHPTITSAFLEQLELFNADGRQVGFVEADGGAVLVGMKRRRGPERAQQTVELNDYTTAVVKQVIALTSTLRAFLRKRGNDDWRYLLLTCERGFARPKRIARLATSTSLESRRDAIVDQMRQLSPGVDKAWIEDLVRRLSLQSVRASAGVLVYLKTHSVREMAEALGHANYEPKLLNRYLPKAIREFFQERWVRLFQNGLILEAMRGRTLAVRASDFETIEEVNAFFIEHALRLPGEDSEQSIGSAPDSEIVFGISIESLTTLLSVSLAVNEVGGAANELSRFWADVATSLTQHIEVGNTGRPDLEGYLREARRRASAASMREMVRRG